MQSIRQISRLNEAELEKVIPPNASWHTDYRDTAYIHIGGLPYELSEGDILTIFSQYGNPTDIKLIRDKDTGKSKGFGFLKYEDQRSCDLAVDNLSGAGVLGRVLGVDHTRYKKKEGEVETVGDDVVEEGDDTDREGDARRKRRRSSGSESGEEEERPVLKEEVELQKLLREHDDDDPMKAYLVKEKKAEIEEARRNAVVEWPKEKERRHKHRHHRHRTAKDDGQRDGDRSNGHRSKRERSEENEDARSGRRPERQARRRSDGSVSGDEARHRKQRNRRESSSDVSEDDRDRSRHR